MNSSQPSGTEEPFVLPYDKSGEVFVAATLFPLFIFGTVANIVTIVVVLTSPKLKSAFYYIMMSLSVSDLLSALISPLFVYRRTWGYEDWQWSDFLCKYFSCERIPLLLNVGYFSSFSFFWGADQWTSYVTSLHILMFSLMRFISVQWPHYFIAFTLKRTQIAIVIVWIVSFAVGFIPYYLWFGAFQRMRGTGVLGSNWPSCSLDVDRIYEFTLYPKIVYSIFFYIPLILVIFLSVGIVIKLYILRSQRSLIVARQSADNTADTTEAKRQRKEKQIILQLCLIVGSFLVGYIPRTAFHFHAVTVTASPKQAIINWWFSVMEYLTLRISECLNPIFYNISSSKMRKETKATFRMICMKCSWRRNESDFKVVTATTTQA